MFRSLIILAVIVIVYLLVRRLLNQKRSASNKTPPQSENMLQCSECGTFIPKKEAFIKGEQHFCCKQHQQDWQSRR